MRKLVVWKLANVLSLPIDLYLCYSINIIYSDIRLEIYFLNCKTMSLVNHKWISTFRGCKYFKSNLKFDLVLIN